MTKKINSNLFNFTFFLSDRKKVKSLEEGAIKYGGATKFNDGIYSNYGNSDFIKIDNSNNNISIFVPSTLNVNKHIDNSYYVNYSYNYIKKIYNKANIKYYDTVGSWFSDDLQRVVIENITIITVELNTITEADIINFIKLATWIKQEMSQEGVSITINTALAIV